MKKAPGILSAPESPEEVTGRSYAEYRDGQRLCFDPLEDLNLPASYEEVVLRYKRLREVRPGTALN